VIIIEMSSVLAVWEWKLRESIPSPLDEPIFCSMGRLMEPTKKNKQILSVAFGKAKQIYKKSDPLAN
jgi:hypothetical protein